MDSFYDTRQHNACSSLLVDTSSDEQKHCRQHGFVASGADESD